MTGFLVTTNIGCRSPLLVLLNGEHTATTTTDDDTSFS